MGRIMDLRLANSRFERAFLVAAIFGCLSCVDSPDGGTAAASPAATTPAPAATGNTPAGPGVPANRAASAPVKPAEPAPQPRETAPGRVTRIMLGDFFPLQQSGEVLIYDVRPAFFHSIGRIPGSVNWPKSGYEKQLVQREGEIRNAALAGRPVVLYCTDLACPDAREIASRLAERGHSVSVLEGGWEGWKAGGLPTE